MKEIKNMENEAKIKELEAIEATLLESINSSRILEEAASRVSL
jgi:hypothetical protein